MPSLYYTAFNYTHVATLFIYNILQLHILQHLKRGPLRKKIQIIDHLLGIVPIRFLSFCWLFVYGRKYAIEKMQVPVVKMQVQGSDNANPWTNIFWLELMVQRLKCCSHFDHDLSVTCPWLVQKLFVTCSWIIHNLFTTCLWLIHDCPWLDYVLFTPCSKLVHDFFITSSWLALDFFITYSRLVHDLFMPRYLLVHNFC